MRSMAYKHQYNQTMKPRRRIHKPLLGFGPAGYVLAAIFLALLIPSLAGVDMQYETQKLITVLFGADAMMRATAYGQIFYLQQFDMGINLITACAGLVAFKIAPSRIKRRNQLAWFCLSALWIAPTLILYNAIVQVYGHSTIHSGLKSIYLTMSLGTLGVTVAGLFAGYITRSKIVSIGWAIALVLNLLQIGQLYTGFYTWFDWPLISLGSFWISTSFIFFYLCSSGSLLLWAILERRKPIPESLCHNCDYDLAGLAPSAPCPECGKAPTPNKPAPTPAP